MTTELSARNPRVSAVRRLFRSRAERRRTARFVVDTPKLVEEALGSGSKVDYVVVPADESPESLESMLVACACLDVEVFSLPRKVFDSVHTAMSPQPAFAVVESPTLAFDERFSDVTLGAVLVLVDVADPGNVGTLVRTAEAAGCSGVVCAGNSADPFGPKAVRASAGSVLRLPIAETSADSLPDELRSAGFTIVVADSSGHDVHATELPERCALVLGSEAHGVRPDIVSRSDLVVSVPMSGLVESLNVATTGAVLAFELDRRRRKDRP